MIDDISSAVEHVSTLKINSTLWQVDEYFSIQNRFLFYNQHILVLIFYYSLNQIKI